MNASWQDYIVGIFDLIQMRQKVNNKAISERLVVSPASVTDMMKKLKAQNYIYDNRGNIELTKEGLELAKNLVSKHRLWELFLQRELKYTWADLHEEARKLQHVTSDTLMIKLSEYLDCPEFCPHGGKIFLNNMEDDYATKLLYDVSEKTKVRISGFSDIKEVLDYIEKKGIDIGDEFVIENIDDFDGIISLVNSKKSVQVGIKASKNIFVVEI